ncbi:MAG: DNA cytosine methyltransferase [bacterium]
MPKVLDLFCGCGGLSYGFEMAGCDILLGIDNDIAALKTFEKNHRGAKSICTDITQISKKDISNLINVSDIDIIVGGPPCQGMSLSGPRKFHDPRNKLYLSYIRLVSEIMPKIFVIENVPGLASLFEGQIKNSILEEFAKLGYTVSYRIINTADFGVPQKRRRIIFVGYKNNHLFNFDNIQCVNEYVTCHDALSDLPALDADFLGAEVQEYVSNPKNTYQKAMRRKSKVVKNHIAAQHSEHVKQIISLVPEGGNYKDLPDEYKNTRNFHVAWTRFDGEQPAPTIDTGHRHHFHYKYNRVPTVRESARLQSFPDHFEFLGTKTQQFKHVGNAVPPLFAMQLAEQILKCL